MVDRAT